MPSCYVTSAILPHAHKYQFKQNHKSTHLNTSFLALMWQTVDAHPTTIFHSNLSI